MKKTLHINLAGHVFSIEEDAFERLDEYLKSVETRLGKGDEAQETLEDINLRMAELFRGVHSDASSPVTLTDVEDVISTLGAPEDYEVPGEEEEEIGQREEEKPAGAPVGPGKQLFRDPDDRVLGGVCSGLGHYFNTGPALFRLLFVIAALFYGSSLLIYIILWIAIPKAITVQQRIRMMGGAPGSDSWRKRQAHKAVVNTSTNGVVRVIAVIAGLILVLFSFGLLVTLIMTLSVSEVVFGLLFSESTWIPEIGHFFLMPWQEVLGYTGLALTLGMPLLVLFYLGMHLIFQFRRGGTAFLVTSLILWLMGTGMLMYTGMSVATGFTRSMEVQESKMLEVPASDTIYVQPSQSSLKLGDGVHVFSKDGISVRKQDDDLVLIGSPHIEVQPGGENFRVKVEKSARGKNSESAVEHANKIEYFYLQDDSLLLLDRYFSIQNVGLFRQQQVDVTLEIPGNKEVKFDERLKPLVRSEE
ncbi:MAG: PspC domain-containing protein [Bacteroidota bacterium]